MTITSEELRVLDKASYHGGEVQWSALSEALDEAWDSGQLVHVDEVEKLREALRSTRDEARKIRANPDKIFSVAVDALGDSHE